MNCRYETVKMGVPTGNPAKTRETRTPTVRRRMPDAWKEASIRGRSHARAWFMKYSSKGKSGQLHQNSMDQNHWATIGTHSGKGVYQSQLVSIQKSSIPGCGRGSGPGAGGCRTSSANRCYGMSGSWDFVKVMLAGFGRSWWSVSGHENGPSETIIWTEVSIRSEPPCFRQNRDLPQANSRESRQLP